MTEKQLLKQLEQRLKREYEDTQSVINQKIAYYTKDFSKDNKLYQDKVKSGEISKIEYRKWYREQVTTQRWCNKMRDEIAEDIAKANEKATEIINGNVSEVYLQGCLEASEEIGNEYFGFQLVDRQQAEVLLKDNAKLLPKGKFDPNKDIPWNKKRIQSAVLQSAIKGEAVPKLAKRLQNVVGMNKTSAMRNARTMMTASRNMGKLEVGEEAVRKGIDVRKKWLATFDSRTRDSHASQHGEVVDVDETFSNGLLSPAHPDGAPAEVYNCRCRMRYVRGPKSEGMTKEEFEANVARIEGEKAEFREANKALNRKPESAKPTVVDGKDITGTWERRSDKFDFEIDDVINAQGFDGLPRVVDADEFDDYVKDSNFVGQRTYSAPDQQTLDAYRDQLYNGKWYVDCGTGGSEFGQGMYCASNYSGQMTQGILDEMKHYQTIGASKIGEFSAEDMAIIAKHQAETANEYLAKYKAGQISKEKAMEAYRRAKGMGASEYVANYMQNYAMAGARSYTETFTLDKTAKIVKYSDLQKIRGIGSLERTLVNNMSLSNNARTTLLNWIDEEGEIELPANLKAIGESLESKAEKLLKMDTGALATALGYDAINVDTRGTTPYTIILNRTKVIFKRG